MNKWKVVAKVILALGCLAGVLCVVFTFVAYYKTMDVGGWVVKASEAGTATQVYEFTSNTLDEMENLGMTEGYSALIFKNPENDMANTYKVLQYIADRALYVSTNTELSTIAQSQALADMRGTLSSIPLFFPCTCWYVINHGMWFFLLWFFPLWPFLGWIVFALIMDFVEERERYKKERL